MTLPTPLPSTSPEKRDTRKTGIKIVVITIILLLILFGLYWAGRIWLLSDGGPGQEGSKAPGSENAAATYCDEVYTDLGLAVQDGLSEGKDVCGIDSSGGNMRNLSWSVFLLENLTMLDLSDNQLTSLPVQVSSARALKYLDLSNNQLTAYPISIGELQQLEVLDVRGNPIPADDLLTLQQLLPQTQVLTD